MFKMSVLSPISVLIVLFCVLDVFSQDQSSSQRPSSTAKVFTTIFSDSASYTTGSLIFYIVEESEAISLLL